MPSDRQSGHAASFPDFSGVDVTVVTLAYRRPHCLKRQLERLEAQRFAGSWELIVWNNNPAIADEVAAATGQVKRFSLTVIHSTTNYMGEARFAAAELARGPLLLFCDDDLVPGPDFLDNFVESHRAYGARTVLCGSAHRFSNSADAARAPWQYLSFGDPDCGVHYAHGNSLFLTTELFREATRRPMPRRDYVLIDDLWLSFVLAGPMGAPLVKIRCDAAWDLSAYDASLALHQNSTIREMQREFVSEHLADWPLTAARRSAAVPPADEGPIARARGPAGGDSASRRALWRFRRSRSKGSSRK
jgi:glycosyltransferase involved in cell wall biosynthesis